MPAHTVPEKASEQPVCPGEGHTVPVITEASLLEEWVCLSIMSQLWRDSLRENRHVDVTSFGISTLGQFLSPLSYLKCFSHQPMACNCHAHPIPLKPIRSSEIVTTVRGHMYISRGKWKSHWETTTHPPQWLKLKTLTIPSADKGQSNRSSHTLRTGTPNGTTALENCLAMSTKAIICIS